MFKLLLSQVNSEIIILFYITAFYTFSFVGFVF